MRTFATTVQAVDIGKLLDGAEPLLKVRLTQLTCGGSILALTLAHAVLGKPASPHAR